MSEEELNKKALEIVNIEICWCPEVYDRVQEIADNLTDFAFDFLEEKWREFISNSNYFREKL